MGMRFSPANDLVATLGIYSMPKSQVFCVWEECDEMFADSRNRPPVYDGYACRSFVALTIKVREDGRVVK